MIVTQKVNKMVMYIITTKKNKGVVKWEREDISTV